MTARIRWLVGGGAVIAAVVIVVAAVLVLGTRPAPEAMTYVPRDSIVVAELRPDFPGDQLSKVGNLLAHFPGFKDQSTLAQKIDETLAKLTRTATNGGVDYASQVKPWLAGAMYGAVLPPDVAPEPSATPDPSSYPAQPAEWLLVATTDGHVRCEDVITGGGSRDDTGAGSMLVSTDRSMGCLLDGRFALLGTPSAVMNAAGAHANHDGIDGAADYRAARDRLGADRLATVYVSRAAMTNGFTAGAATGLASLDPAMTQAFAALPAWVMAGIRAEDNALVADVVSAPFTAVIPGLSLAPGASLLTAPPAHASRLASLLPADTAVLVEAHGGGVALSNLLIEIRSMPDLSSSIGQLDTALATLGGAGSLLGWIGDAGVVVVPDGTSLTGGLVLEAPDEATANAKAAQLTSLVRLAGLAGSVALSVTETTIDGTHVTLADFGDLSSLLGPSGSGLQVGGAPIPPGTHLVISIAAHGTAVLIGSGESFVRHVLETAAGSTLADQATYKSAVALATPANQAQLFVAAAPLLRLADSAIPAAELARYESDVKPYLVPLDAFLETTTMDASGLRVRIVLTVK